MHEKQIDHTQKAFSLLYTPISMQDTSLVITEGPHREETLRLDREILMIGRADWCDLSLKNDPKVSSEHCQIIISEEGIRVRDLGSRNGTFFGEHNIIEAYLTPNSTLRVGDSLLELHEAQKRKKIYVQYHDDSGQLVGKHPRMRQLFAWISRIGPRDIPVLLTGETGTGKTHIAKSIHQLSERKTGPFVEVNCGALPGNLIESQLFGYERGAFTDATQSHEGFFQQANGGTLFLDEIGELPIDLQPKLLRVIESKKFRKIGAKKDQESDFRLITATHRNLPEAIKEGSFRQDLYFRVNVFKLDIPPLRERPEDIPLLCAIILEAIAPTRTLKLLPNAIHKLQQYLWPGNVRELRSVLERCNIFIDDRNMIDENDLFFDSFGEDIEPVSALLVHSGDNLPANQADEALSRLLQEKQNYSLQEFIDLVESSFIQHALDSKGSVQEAAEHLKVSRGLIYKRIHKYSLDVP